MINWLSFFHTNVIDNQRQSIGLKNFFVWLSIGNWLADANRCQPTNLIDWHQFDRLNFCWLIVIDFDTPGRSGFICSKNWITLPNCGCIVLWLYIFIDISKLISMSLYLLAINYRKFTRIIEYCSSVQADPKWVFRSHLPSCSESAEILHVYSFCVKKCPCGFFQECRNIWTKLRQIQPPPPPSLSVSKQRRISIFEGQNTVHVSFMLLEGYWGGGGGGVNFSMCLKPCFPACGNKKIQGHFLTQKE